MSDPARELIIEVNNDAKTVTIRSGTTIITVYGHATVASIAYSDWGLHKSYHAISGGVSEYDPREAAR